MDVFKAGFWFLLIVCVAKSDDENLCEDTYKDMRNIPINITQYCANESCIIKCCGIDEILDSSGQCDKATNFKKLYPYVNYSAIEIYSWDESTVTKSKNKTIKDFVFVQNDKFVASKNCTYEYPIQFYILEDGSMKADIMDPNEPLIDINKMDYCIDFRVTDFTEEANITLVYKEPKKTDIDLQSKFLAIGMLTSCFFMLMVLIVYCLLRQLRNIVGMVLMAYVSTLLVAYLLKATIELKLSSFSAEECKIMSSFLYYTVLSSFFWLSIMSFDVWWTFRGNRKCRDIHRRGELVKFLWYCLYAWGAPLLMTIAALIVDSLDLDDWPSIYKPYFDECFSDGGTVFRYLHIPIAIITVLNIILFIMTAYNIWLIKRGLSCKDYRKSKIEENRFAVYIKLAVMMGVSWVLELIPDGRLWLFVVVNFYNVFVGVTIFFLFVFKKSILIMLCKRFHIKSSFVQNLQSTSQYSKSDTRSSTVKSSRVPIEEPQESVETAF